MSSTDTDPEPTDSSTTGTSEADGPIWEDAPAADDAGEPTAAGPGAPRGTRRGRTKATRRSIVLAVIAAAAASSGNVALTGAPMIDSLERFVLVAIVTFVGSHAHRWAWFVTGALAAVVLRDVPLLITLLGLGVAVGSTQLRNRSKELGAISVGLVQCAVFWSAGSNLGWPTVPVEMLVIGILLISGFPNLRRRQRRALGWFLALVALGLLGATALTAFAIVRSADDVSAGSAAARDALEAVRAGETENARAQLTTASQSLTAAQGNLGNFARPGLLVPGLAQQARAVTTSVDHAKAITDGAAPVVERNYHSLRYRGQIDLGIVEDLRKPAAEIDLVLAEANTAMADLQGQWLLPQLDERVDEFAADIESARLDTELATEALKVVPDLLGRSEPRRYLIAFITPAELRGGGGFIGSWAELRAVNGKVDLTESGRIVDLIQAKPVGTRVLRGPTDYVSRYGRFQPQDYLQDVTYSPNWPSNAAVLADLYQQTTGREVHGVIGVDPKGLSALLQFTGPVQVPDLPVPLSATNAVELLTRQQYIQFADRAEREDVLAGATKATFEQLVKASLPAPITLGDVLGPAARGRHLQLWSRNDAEQAFFGTVHASSALSIPEAADGFTVVQQNVGNNKLDAYLQRSITYDVTVDASDGSLAGTMTVVLRNTNENLTLPDPVVSNRRGAPRGTNVASLSVHAPWTVTSATIDGAEEPLGRDEEVGLPVWDTPILQVPPGGEVTIVATIEGNLDLSDGYQLRVLPQPVANADEVDLRVRLDGGSFGTPDGDDGSLTVEATPQELHLSGRLEQIVDLVVPASR